MRRTRAGCPSARPSGRKGKQERPARRPATRPHGPRAQTCASSRAFAEETTAARRAVRHGANPLRPPRPAARRCQGDDGGRGHGAEGGEAARAGPDGGAPQKLLRRRGRLPRRGEVLPCLSAHAKSAGRRICGSERGREAGPLAAAACMHLLGGCSRRAPGAGGAVRVSAQMRGGRSRL